MNVSMISLGGPMAHDLDPAFWDVATCSWSGGSNSEGMAQVACERDTWLRENLNVLFVKPGACGNLKFESVELGLTGGRILKQKMGVGWPSWFVSELFK